MSSNVRVNPNPPSLSDPDDGLKNTFRLAEILRATVVESDGTMRILPSRKA